MCFKTPKECRRTKTVCENPKCMARWRAEEKARMVREVFETLDQVVQAYETESGTLH